MVFAFRSESSALLWYAELCRTCVMPMGEQCNVCTISFRLRSCVSFRCMVFVGPAMGDFLFACFAFFSSMRFLP